jgi:cytoskeletal protein CcmA (bactofilin family)
MAAPVQDKILVVCPKCGHSQPEPRTGYSTLCRKCGAHFRIQEVVKSAKKIPASKAKVKAEPKAEIKRVTCFDCGTVLHVAPSAQSTMCKRCSSYLDLKDYQIANAVSKNFKTKGVFILEPTGYVFNTEIFVGEAILKGRLLGKLRAEGSLTIYDTAEIKGTITAGCLVIPSGNRFRWKDVLKLGGADIAGELVANVQAEGTVVIRSTARLFGDVVAKGLVVEEGAVVVGQMKIEIAPAVPPPAAPATEKRQTPTPAPAPTPTPTRTRAAKK